MSLLAEKLTALIKNKEIPISKLSKKLEIDDSTFRQYLRGKRPIRDFQLLEKLIYQLALSNNDYEEVIKLFDFENGGEKIYMQREAVENFYNNLSVPQIISSTQITNKIEIDRNFLDNDLDVKNLIFNIFNDASKNDIGINLMINPHTNIGLPTILSMLGNEKIIVNHFICFDNNITISKNYNLDSIGLIIKCLFITKLYTPYCYYGDICQYFNDTILYPNVICANNIVMLISNDLQKSMVIKDRKIIEQYSQQFKQMKFKSKNILCLNADYLSDKQPIYRLSQGIPVDFFDKYLIDTYGRITKTLPEIESDSILLLNKSCLEQFIDDGKYYENLFERPFEKKDIIYLLKLVYNFYKKKETGLCFIDKNFPYNREWEMMITDKDDIVFKYISKEKNKVLSFHEPVVAQVIYEYCKYLLSSRFVYDHKESLNILIQMLRKLGENI